MKGCWYFAREYDGGYGFEVRIEVYTVHHVMAELYHWYVGLSQALGSCAVAG